MFKIRINKSQIIDFTILILRWYLAFYMIEYGYAKLMGDQFGVYNPHILSQPMRQINKFYIAWYLFSLSRTFDIVNGVFQIIGGLLVIVNRTANLGALLLLPIIIQIFLIDISFTTDIFGTALVFRLGGMIISDLLILFYYREKLISSIKLIICSPGSGAIYKWWIYLLLPVLGFLMDFVWGVFNYLIRLIFHFF